MLNGLIPYIKYPERDTIHLLDELFKKWEIAEKGTNEFKGKLKENWLEKKENRRRDVCNDTLSAISELVAATSLASNGYTMVDLSAWGNKDADIVCTKNNAQYFFEVKYLPDSPEFYDLEIAFAKGNGVSCSFISNSPTMLNYFYFRLAEAIMQLSKKDIKGRYVFFIYNRQSDNTCKTIGRKLFENSINNPNDWYFEYVDDDMVKNQRYYPPIMKDEKGEETYFEKEIKPKILCKTPVEWLKKINKLFIGTLDNWALQNITINFSGLNGSMCSLKGIHK